MKTGRSHSPSVTNDDVDGEAAHPWQRAYRAALSPYIIKRILILLGLYLGTYIATCPLGDSVLTWTERTAYISLCTAFSVTLCYSEYVVTLYLTRFWSPPGIVLAVAGVALIAAPTTAAIAYGVGALVSPELLAPADWPTVYLFLMMSVLICGAVVHYLVGQRIKDEAAAEPRTDALPRRSPDAPIDHRALLPATADRDSGAPHSAFLRRLPAEAGQDIIYLKMSDHYVEVVTATGRCALLMRFADAIDELADAGIRVHRSYWVALRHMDGWTRRDQRMFLCLAGGHTVPVSRTYLARTRAALDGRQRPQPTGAEGAP